MNCQFVFMQCSELRIKELEVLAANALIRALGERREIELTWRPASDSLGSSVSSQSLKNHRGGILEVRITRGISLALTSQKRKKAVAESIWTGKDGLEKKVQLKELQSSQCANLCASTLGRQREA